MLRQLKARRNLTTLLCLLTLCTLSLTRLFRDRTAEAAPPALIASAAARPSARAGKVERLFENSNTRSNEDGARDGRVRKLSWARVRADGNGFVEVKGDGSRAELTLDPALQARVDRL